MCVSSRTRDYIGQKKRVQQVRQILLDNAYGNVFAPPPQQFRVLPCRSVGSVAVSKCCCRYQVVRIKSAVSSLYVLSDFLSQLHFLQHTTQFSLMCPMVLSFLSIVAKVSLYVMYCNSI